MEQKNSQTEKILLWCLAVFGQLVFTFGWSIGVYYTFDSELPPALACFGLVIGGFMILDVIIYSVNKYCSNNRY